MFRRNSIIKKDRTVILVLCGVLLGFYIGLWTGDDILPCVYGENMRDETVIMLEENAKVQHNSNNMYNVPEISEILNNPKLTEKKGKKDFILIGVMTAKKYLYSRIISSFETWATNIPGKVLYFSSEGSEKVAPKGLPVIGLKGVDDSYPPQKKSFLMIKYMYEYYGDQYEWFVRADDDVYIKSDKM